MARNWTTTAGVKDPESLGYSVNTNKRIDPDDDTKQNTRNQVTASWRWGGVDLETKIWHTTTYRGDNMAIGAAAKDSIHLNINGIPTTGSNTLNINGFADNTVKKILAQQHLMIWPNAVIYTVTEDATVTEDYETIVAATGDSAFAIVVDETNDHIYWSSAVDKIIYRCDLDGSNKTTVFTSASAIYGITLDVDNSLIYYVSAQDTIRSVGFAGTGDSEILATGKSPLGITKNAAMIYFTSKTDNKILSFDLSNPLGTVADIKTGLSGPVGIDYDSINDKIYFCEQTGGSVSVIDEDGNNYVSLNSIADARGVAVDGANEYIYVSRNQFGDVFRMNLDGSDRVTVVETTSHCLDVCFTDTDVYSLLGDSDDSVIKVDKQGALSVSLSVTPAITADAVAFLADTDSDVYFFIPTTTDGQKQSGDGSLNAIEIDEEFFTLWRNINQPEEDDAV